MNLRTAWETKLTQSFSSIPRGTFRSLLLRYAFRFDRFGIKMQVVIFHFDGPQGSGQKRPTGIMSKPANGFGPGLSSFSLVSPAQASLFSFSSSVVRISGCDRGVIGGRAWR